LPMAADPRVVVRPLSERVAGLPFGTPYVLCLLKPSRDMTLDTDDLALALRVLSESPGTSVPASIHTPISVPAGDYAVVAGLIGHPADLVFASNLPFTKRIQLDWIGV